jgi:hypothetical protein
MEGELPENVTNALRSNPHCSLSISEALSFKATSGAGAGTATTTREYFLLCPHMDALLIERSSSQRQVAAGEALEGMLGGGGAGGGGGGGGLLGRGWPPQGLEALLPHWQRGAFQHPPQPQPQQPLSPQQQQQCPRQQQQLPQQQRQPERRPPAPGAIQV